MIISHKFEFIWFQPRKDASTTVFERLGSYNESEYQQQNYYNKYLNKMSSKHISYEDFLELPEAKLNYKKVSFVRNPYDRFYSDFLQCKRDFTNNHGKFDTKPWGFILAEGFSRFCEFAFMKYSKGDFFISIKSNYENVFFNGQQTVDFIGYVERFETDFFQICSDLKINPSSNKSSNIENLQVECDTSSMRVKDYKYINYFSNEQIEICNNIFADDFEYLNYKKIKH